LKNAYEQIVENRERQYHPDPGEGILAEPAKKRLISG
jgi:hypothetical protein